MVAVRLEEELEKKLNTLAQKEKKTKSAIIKEALKYYFTLKNNQNYPYELGKKLFGQVGSGDGTLSQTYKSKLKEKIRAKNDHR